MAELRVVSVAFSASTSLKSAQLPINLAKGEVIQVYAPKYMHNRGYGSALYERRSVLYRKTEKLPTTGAFMSPTGGWQGDKSVIDAWFYKGDSAATNESVDATPPCYQVYPIPITLIRKPTLVLHCTDAFSSVSFLLWYTTKKVSDKNLTELMMEDHA